MKFIRGIILAVLVTTVAVALDTTAIATHSIGRLPCKHNVPADEFRRVKWYKSSRNNVFENVDLALVVWDNVSQPVTTGRFGIDKDFALNIKQTSIEDEGLYRCHITRKVEPHSFAYNIKLTIYALPVRPPLIQRVNQTFINCSVDRVYPLLYPHVEFKHEAYAVQNEDETYNTSVRGSMQNTRGKVNAVDCSFPYFNYSEVSSLILYPTTAVTLGNDDEPDPTIQTGSKITTDSPNQGSKNIVPLLFIISAPHSAVIVIIAVTVSLILYRRKNRKKILQARTTNSSASEELGMLETPGL